MSKSEIVPKPSADTEAIPISNSYRIERLTTYEWQGYEITKLSSDTFIEKPLGKPDAREIVMNKMNELMKQEALNLFKRTKQQDAV